MASPLLCFADKETTSKHLHLPHLPTAWLAELIQEPGSCSSPSHTHHRHNAHPKAHHSKTRFMAAWNLWAASSFCTNRGTQCWSIGRMHSFNTQTEFPPKPAVSGAYGPEQLATASYAWVTLSRRNPCRNLSLLEARQSPESKAFLGTMCTIQPVLF